MHTAIQKEKRKRKKGKIKLSRKRFTKLSGPYSLISNFQLMNPPLSLFRKPTFDQWLVVANRLSAALPFASLLFGWFTYYLLAFLSKALELHPQNSHASASFSSVAAVGVVLLMQIVSLVFGIVSLVGGIKKMNILMILLSLFGILVSGFLSYFAFFAFSFLYGAMMGEAC